MRQLHAFIGTKSLRPVGGIDKIAPVNNPVLSQSSVHHQGVKPVEAGEAPHLLIAKQDVLYAETLAWTASLVFPTAEIKSVGSGVDFLKYLESQSIDFLVLGLNFIDLDAHDLLRQISEQKLARHVMVVVDARDEWLTPRLQSARIDAILDLSSETLTGVQQAMRWVNDGRSYVSPSLHSYLVGQAEANDTYSKLSQGELRVLRLIGAGQGNKETGKALGLSVSTVQTHRRNIMRKLNVTTSPKLVREAIRLGLAKIADHPTHLTRETSGHQ